MTNGDTIDVLNDLIESSKDGEYGFAACAERARDPGLKSTLGERAQQCRAAAAELQTLVVDLGGEPEKSGSAAGAVHRGWVSVKTAFTRDDDLAVLEEAERGEDVALKVWRDALENDLPASVRPVVARHFEGVKRNHAHVRSLRDAARAARV